MTWLNSQTGENNKNAEIAKSTLISLIRQCSQIADMISANLPGDHY